MGKLRLGLHLSRGSPPRYESGARSANQSELSRHSLGPISTPKQRQRRRCNVLSAGLRGRLSRPAGSRPALFCSVLRLSLSLSRSSHSCAPPRQMTRWSWSCLPDLHKAARQWLSSYPSSQSSPLLPVVWHAGSSQSGA